LPALDRVLDAQARYLGSAGYYQAHGGSPRDLVIALYGDVLHRPPTETEIQRWASRLSATGDGDAMAREFLLFARSELAARAAMPTPVLIQRVYVPVPAAPAASGCSTR
jgi:hypothetical protein